METPASPQVCRCRRVTQASSQTRRGAADPRRSVQVRVSAGRQAAASAGAAERSPARDLSRSHREAPGEVKSCDLLRPPSEPKPGFLLPFPLNTCSSLCPLSSCPRDTHLWRVCVLSHIALASVEGPSFHTPGDNLLMLQDIKTSCG